MRPSSDCRLSVVSRGYMSSPVLEAIVPCSTTFRGLRGRQRGSRLDTIFLAESFADADMHEIRLDRRNSTTRGFGSRVCVVTVPPMLCWSDSDTSNIPTRSRTPAVPGIGTIRLNRLGVISTMSCIDRSKRQTTLWRGADGRDASLATSASIGDSNLPSP